MVGRDASSGGSQVAHTGTQGVWIMYYNCSEMWGNTHTDIIVCKLWDRIKYTLSPPPTPTSHRVLTLPPYTSHCQNMCSLSMMELQ